MRSARLSLAVLLFCIVGLAAVVALPGQALAQAKEYHMDRYDSIITVNPDGSMDIVESLTYVFTSGTFRRGLRTWDLDRVSGIAVKSVTESGNPKFTNYTKGAFDPDNSTTGVVGTYGTEKTETQLRLRWIFGDTANATRTFQVAYHVDGAIRVYANHDELDWYAVPPGWGSSIDASRVSVTFPGGTDTSAWDVAAIPKDAEVSKRGNTITWSTGSISSGGFEVGAFIPTDALNATKPSWQDAFDRQFPQQSGNTGSTGSTGSSGSSGSISLNSPAPVNGTRALIDLTILLVSVVLLFGGILWRLVVWYKQGRDEPVRLPIDYLAEPPSDLPPGLVGTLLDESADVRDVIATIADLGRKGNLTISETQTNGLRDYAYTRTGNKTDYYYEEMVMQALFGDGQTANLSTLRANFQTSLPPIYKEMYKNLVALNYFPQSPEEVRNSASRGCGWIFFLGAVAFFAGLIFGAQLSYMLVALGVTLAILAVVRLFTSSAMPRKTDFGADQAARWRAFKRYLQQMKHYTDVQAAAGKFQQYLPYAVAMNIDHDFTRQFNSVPAAMPPWYAPLGYQSILLNTLASAPGYVSPAPYAAGGSPPLNVGGATTPINPGGAMQEMSSSLGGAMQGLSDSFTGMVNSAATVFSGGSIASSAKITGGTAGNSAGSVASSVGGLLVSVALAAVFGGGGGGGGGGGAD